MPKLNSLKFPGLDEAYTLSWEKLKDKPFGKMEYTYTGDVAGLPNIDGTWYKISDDTPDGLTGGTLSLSDESGGVSGTLAIGSAFGVIPGCTYYKCDWNWANGECAVIVITDYEFFGAPENGLYIIGMPEEPGIQYSLTCTKKLPAEYIGDYEWHNLTGKPFGASGIEIFYDGSDREIMGEGSSSGNKRYMFVHVSDTVYTAEQLIGAKVSLRTVSDGSSAAGTIEITADGINDLGDGALAIIGEMVIIIPTDNYNDGYFPKKGVYFFREDTTEDDGATYTATIYVEALVSGNVTKLPSMYLPEHTHNLDDISDAPPFEDGKLTLDGLPEHTHDLADIPDAPFEDGKLNLAAMPEHTHDWADLSYVPQYSWNNLLDTPFESPKKTVTWDGNTAGREQSENFYFVNSHTPNLWGCTVEVTNSETGETSTLTIDNSHGWGTEDSVSYSLEFGSSKAPDAIPSGCIVYVVYKSTTRTPGLYLYSKDGLYVSSITYEYGPVKQLDPQVLPGHQHSLADIPGALFHMNEITWDGNTEGLAVCSNLYYRISSETPFLTGAEIQLQTYVETGGYPMTKFLGEARESPGMYSYYTDISHDEIRVVVVVTDYEQAGVAENGVYVFCYPESAYVSHIKYGAKIDRLCLPADFVPNSANALNGKHDSYYTPYQNLLDNGDFRNPVNQRGETTYTEVGFTIDRWQLTGSGCTVSIGSDGLTVTGGTGCYLEQKVRVAAGEALTAVYKLGDTIHMVEDEARTTGVRFGTGVSLERCDGYTSVKIDPNERISSGSVTIEWIALYRGYLSNGTPIDALGLTESYVPPYVPKGYGAELAECQRYLQYRSTGDAPEIDLRPTMVKTPTVTQIAEGKWMYSAED